MGKRILLYGKSILIAGLADSLKAMTDMEVVRSETLDALAQPPPDLILVDLNDNAAAHALPQLCALPHVHLMGIDASTNTLTSLSRESHSARSIQELKTLLSDLFQNSPAQIVKNSSRHLQKK